MKKIYQTPKQRAIDLDMQQIIAQSEPTVPVNNDPENGVDADESLSRDNKNLWDQEW